MSASYSAADMADMATRTRPRRGGRTRGGTGTGRARDAEGRAREAKERRSEGAKERRSDAIDNCARLMVVLDESEDLAVERGGARGAKALGGGETAVAAEEVRLERVGAELDRG